MQHFSCPPQRDKCSQDTPQYCSHHHHRRPIASHCGLKTNLVVNMESNKTTSCLWGKSQCNWLSHNAHDQSSQLQPSRHGTWSKLAIQVTIDWTQQWRLSARRFFNRAIGAPRQSCSILAINLHQNFNSSEAQWNQISAKAHTQKSFNTNLHKLQWTLFTASGARTRWT